MVNATDDLTKTSAQLSQPLDEDQAQANHVVDGNEKADDHENAAQQTTPTWKEKTKWFEEFPVEELPEPICGVVADVAKAIGCDASYIALAHLSALASAIGNSRCLEITKDWKVPPNLWTALVGDSGSRKTPALRTSLYPVFKQDAAAAKQNARAYKEYEIELAFYKKRFSEWMRDKDPQSRPPEAPEPPQAKRFIVNDTTIEALAPILQANPRGILLYRDELTGWLQNFSRNTSKGGSGSEAWLSMYSGTQVIINRKTGPQREIRIPNANVSIVGGIQFDILRRTLGPEHRESGMLGRFLLTCPSRTTPRFTKEEIDPDIEAAVVGIFDRLYELQPAKDEQDDPMPALVTLSDDAEAELFRFFNQNRDEQKDLHGDLDAAWGKFEEIPARLSLVIHHVRWAADDSDLLDPNAVDAKTMRAAVRLTEWFKSETQRIYDLLVETYNEAVNRKLAEWVERKGGSVTVRETQQGQRMFENADDVEAALNKLVKAEIGFWETVPPGRNGGRAFARFVLCPAPVASTTLLETEENQGAVACNDVSTAEKSNRNCGGGI